MANPAYRPLVPNQVIHLLPTAQPVDRQVLPKSKWEELKPVIRRLYIDENKTFRKIATIIRDTYNFTPTKGQFDARVKQWGFKKNASQHERRMILQGGGQNVVGAHGRFVKQSTLERWGKEFNKGKLGLQMLLLCLRK